MRRKQGLTLVDDSGKVLKTLRDALEDYPDAPDIDTDQAAGALDALSEREGNACILDDGTSPRATWRLLEEAYRRGCHVPFAILAPPAENGEGARGRLSPTTHSEHDAETEDTGAVPRALPLTYYDPLTGLPNRSLFTQWLSRAIGRAQLQSAYRFAVLLVDLDRFKMVNESLGHETGDQLLRAIARRLHKHLRFSDAVARISGDEFTILLDDIQDVSDAVRIANRVHLALQDPFRLADQDIFPTVSIGIALSATGYDRPEQMLQDAETAMYRAKTAEAGYEIFDPEMRRRAREMLRLASDLRRAVERGEFTLHYQPIVSLKSHSVTGFEALVRWIHPVRGFVSPGEFIPAAEETGQIIQIGEWVLFEACQQMARWQRDLREAAPAVINVNLSRKQLAEPGLVRRVSQTLRATGLAPSSLNLEITESMVMENTNSAIDTLMHLRSLGAHVSIDDFGTGYSSLSCLHRLPIQTIKIDRSFVSRMGLDVESSEIVRTIVALARNLHKTVVAEGVETTDQLARLEALGCDLAQGFLFSRPVPAADAGKLFSAPLFDFAEAD